MHKSLRPQSSLLLISIWAAVIIAFLFGVRHPSKILVLGIGAVAGSVAGALQLRAMRESRERFLAAKNAEEVRAALMSSKSGRFSTYSLYVVVGILVTMALIDPATVWAGVLAGYASYALLRDSIAVKGCIDLQRTSQASGV